MDMDKICGCDYDYKPKSHSLTKHWVLNTYAMQFVNVDTYLAAKSPSGFIAFGQFSKDGLGIILTYVILLPRSPHTAWPVGGSRLLPCQGQIFLLLCQENIIN